MATPKKPDKINATYQDVLDAPATKVAEVVDGDLYLSPRPAPPHAVVTAALGGELMPPFQRGRGGPGGWIILGEPELHLAETVVAGVRRAQIVVPDLAGWRRARMPRIPDLAYFTLAPDWVCEVASPSTRWLDRTKKLAVYGAAGVIHAWIADPRDRTVEVLHREAEDWKRVALHQGDIRARLPPFDAIELDLAVLWEDLEALPPVLAGEEAADYGSVL